MAAQSARRRHPVWERHSAPGCSVAVRYAGVAYPRLRLRGEPKAQFESAALLRRAGCPIPEVASVRVPTSAGAGRVRTVRPLMPAAIVSCPQAAAVPETARSLMPAAIASCPQAASAKAQVAEILDRAHASAEAVRGQPAKTVARFPAYLHKLLAFDGIAAVSADSRDSLLDYWRWLGVRATPPVQAIPLGVDEKCHPMGDTSEALSAGFSRSLASRSFQ